MARAMNQVRESDHFHDQNNAEVMRVQSLIINAAQRFLGGNAKAILPAEIVVEAENAVQHANIGCYCQVIRPYAAKFVEARTSAAFWTIVDACNFFISATSTQWAYMTQERRQQNLIWAAEEAALV